MKKRRLFIATISFTLFLISCRGTSNIEYLATDYALSNKYTEWYKGSTKKEIIEQIGIPDRIVDMGEGEVIVYETYKTTTNTESTGGNYSITTTKTIGGTTISQTTPHGNNGTIEKSQTKRTSFKEFYLDNEGKCYRVSIGKMQRL